MIGARGRARWFTHVAPMMVVLLLIALPGSIHAQTYPVEARYAPVGPAAVATQTVTDAAGVEYAIYRPAHYTTLGFLSPIVTWGNGTDSTPDMYSVLLGHLASYGFTVIAPMRPNVGSGAALAAAARYLLARNRTAGSVFRGRLDPGAIAAVGHSQGAGGAVRAAVNNPTLIDTVVTFSLPNTRWVGAGADCPTKSDCQYDPSRLTQPTFLISTHGLLDFVIASTSTEQAFYRQVRGHAALGLMENSAGARADHNTIQNSGGPYGFLGYVTAWLLAQLRADSTAAAAFGGSSPELVSNTNWPNSAVK
ncbi:Alpha/beta hydrolase [Frankia sp. AiPs1]|uniref:hypothetical protein n=1 Tax=Frankia sp. AiPa1 TaxID=573492 RepID=UPI00202B4663|nr:hypothetical protein [Frankia sp. AiPa1]MCL9758600.1 hypothetical protein [Frankia sp. AiPa1]